MKQNKKIVYTKKREFSFSEMSALIKSKPFFFIALLIVIIFAILLLFIPQTSVEASDKAEYAKQVHADNVYAINGLIDMVDQNKPTPETTLDDDYYYSIRDDLEWLKVKEDYLYNLKPSTATYPREIAFALFAGIIVQINDSFSIEAGESNQTEKINQALDANVIPRDFLSGDMDAQLAFSSEERKTFSDTIAYLTEKYVSDKKDLITKTTSQERKYVEAKKILLLSEYS
ncbi:MAG: hypothetical protein WCW44_03110 [archaeon]|jgi:hypothetical protein